MDEEGEMERIWEVEGEESNMYALLRKNYFQ